MSWLRKVLEKVPARRQGGWYLAEDPLGEVHVIPASDAIGHEADECPCGPDLEANSRDDGSIGWLHVHHSLDNREKNERGV